MSRYMEEFVYWLIGYIFDHEEVEVEVICRKLFKARLIQREYVDGVGYFIADIPPEFMGENDRIQTADVVEVVRCTDCKFWQYYCNGDFNMQYGYCRCRHWENYEYEIETTSGDYCSYGERADE